MLVGVRWLNSYLPNAPVSTAEIERALVHAGFPIESSEPLPGGDTRLDVEITSNRGDCLSVLGLAREVAAQRREPLSLPPTPAYARDSSETRSHVRVENTTPSVCPRFTARVILGVKVGPSPAWLREALESVGQRSINNIVDVTNYVNFELGQPCHAFDLDRLGGRALVVRFARDKEALTTLDGKPRVLRSDELVVADAERAQGLAGVMGGGDSEVTERTVNVVLEVATWDPVTVRRAARRHGLRTDASARYERLVDARAVDANADRAAALLASVSGGRLCAAPIAAGPEVSALERVHFRPRRCRELLGFELAATEMIELLGLLGIECAPVGRGGDEATCTIPAWRPDLTREVDLIEEVARVKGLDAIPNPEKVSIRVGRPQESERARREIAGLLVGVGFYEAVTYAFASRGDASAFLPRGLALVEVDDDRRQEEPALRPSVVPGLLACRRENQNAGVGAGVRLFEIASVFAQTSARESLENQNLALLMDVPQSGRSASVDETQRGVRALRGAVEAVVRAAAGAGVTLTIEPREPHSPAFEGGGYAGISLDARPLGYLGVISKATQARYDLANAVVAAELNLPMLLAAYPPRGAIKPLPAFPAIERDLSLVVAENVAWASVEKTLASTKAPGLEGWSFVGTYRGEQVGKGRKSVTLRLRFRDPGRTLRHEEVEGPIAAIVSAMQAAHQAQLRA
jgi:phenylalanyl-tRNA synthetase beta chain